MNSPVIWKNANCLQSYNSRVLSLAVC